MALSNQRSVPGLRGISVNGASDTADTALKPQTCFSASTAPFAKRAAGLFVQVPRAASNDQRSFPRHTQIHKSPGREELSPYTETVSGFRGSVSGVSAPEIPEFHEVPESTPGHRVEFVSERSDAEAEQLGGA